MHLCASSLTPPLFFFFKPPHPHLCCPLPPSPPFPSPRPLLLLPSSHRACPPLSLEQQQQQQQWSFTASPRLTVREYTSGEQNGYGREPEQPVLRHGQLPPRPLVTARVRAPVFRSPLGPVWVHLGLKLSSVRGAKPRRDKRQARCVCCVYVCVSFSLCVGWIDSAEETQTHRLLSACYFSLPPLLLFVYFSRFSARRPHCNFSSIIWKILSFFSSSSSSRGL